MPLTCPMLDQILPPFAFTVRLAVIMARRDRGSHYRGILHLFIGWVRFSINPPCHGLVLTPPVVHLMSHIQH